MPLQGGMIMPLELQSFTHSSFFIEAVSSFAVLFFIEDVQSMQVVVSFGIMLFT